MPRGCFIRNMRNEKIYITDGELKLLWFLKFGKTASQTANTLHRSVRYIRVLLSDLYNRYLLSKKRMCREVKYWTPPNVLIQIEEHGQTREY